MKNKIVFLVEDNPDDVDLTLRSFKKSGFENELVIARDGVEALDYIFASGAHQGRDIENMPVLILLDLKLPKVNGIEVLRRLKSDPRTHSIPVVVLTSSNEDRDKMEAYKLRANSYIRKPVDFTAFNDVLRQLGVYWLTLNEAPPAAQLKETPA